MSQASNTPSVPLDIERERERLEPQMRDDGWTDPDTGEWVSMPSVVRPLVRPERYEKALAELEYLRLGLRAIAIGNWNVGRNPLIPVNEYAERILDHEEDSFVE